MNVFVISIPNEKERKICEFKMDLLEFQSKLFHVWKWVWKMTFFWSEKSSWFGETGDTSPLRIPKSDPLLGEILILSYLVLATINNYWIPLSYYLKNIIIKIEERPRRITPSEISIILQIIRKPNSIIVL